MKGGAGEGGQMGEGGERGEVAPLKHQTFGAIVSTVQRRTAENILRQPLPPPAGQLTAQLGIMGNWRNDRE